MLWSFPLAVLGGTVVRLHVTFLLFLVWIGASYWRAGGQAAAVDGVVYILLLFACVLAHEFGHILAARRYGIRTPEVTLWPIGGVASLERIPEKPGEELVVALAGPAVNVVIAAALLLFIAAGGGGEDLTRLEDPGVSLVGRLAGANIFLSCSTSSPPSRWTAAGCCAPSSRSAVPTRRRPASPRGSGRGRPSCSPWRGCS